MYIFETADTGLTFFYKHFTETEGYFYKVFLTFNMLLNLRDEERSFKKLFQVLYCQVFLYEGKHLERIQYYMSRESGVCFASADAISKAV